MSNKVINPNAKKALNQMKLEIENELGITKEYTEGALNSAYINGGTGGKVGGMMSKKLVEIGERALLAEYYSRDK